MRPSPRIPHADNAKQNREKARDFRGLRAVLSITGCFRLGEQAQVDWGHFGHLLIGRARRPLMAFVMVLSYSRQIFLRFYLDAR
ncbi:MAG TPA: hypothetical protein VGI68_17505, partial [Mycobacterium sp.]